LNGGCRPAAAVQFWARPVSVLAEGKEPRRWEDQMVTAELVSRARQGDGDAFGQLVDGYRRELQVHCYRILGSAADAEDVLQETVLAAWQGIGDFAERSSIRTWLYRIATNRSLNALRSASRRPVMESSLVWPNPPEPARGDHRREPGPRVRTRNPGGRRARPGNRARRDLRFLGPNGAGNEGPASHGDPRQPSSGRGGHAGGGLRLRHVVLAARRRRRHRTPRLPRHRGTEGSHWHRRRS